MRFSVLASGSLGNACYVETDRTAILIDAGLSCREIFRRLERIHVTPSRLDALIITHEHADHIRGAGPLARRLGIPVFLNHDTYQRGLRAFGDLPKPVLIHTGHTVPVGDLRIETFTKCHDAVDPIGILVSCHDSRLGVITDLGRSTRLVTDRLRGCHALVVEFNHDVDMLDHGSYPLHVKRRIKGPDGHLSNHEAGLLVRSLAHEDLGILVPAHMSRENNRPDVVEREALNALAQCGLDRTRLEISSQEEPTPLMEVLRSVGFSPTGTNHGYP